MLIAISNFISVRIQRVLLKYGSSWSRFAEREERTRREGRSDNAEGRVKGGGGSEGLQQRGSSAVTKEGRMEAERMSPVKAGSGKMIIPT